MDPEICILPLPNGWSLETGAEPDSELAYGDWVRLVNPEGEEVLFWDSAEWQEDPVLVMGAILNSARKYSMGLMPV